MGQKFTEVTCENYLGTDYAYSSIEPFPLAKDETEEATPLVKEPSTRRNYTTENLNRWIVRFSKAKTSARRRDDLRRQALLQCAVLQASRELRTLQVERQKRWRELKSVLVSEVSPELKRPSYFTEDFLKSKMAEREDKMADGQNKMAADERRSSGLAKPGVNRKRCSCRNSCLCFAEPDGKRRIVDTDTGSESAILDRDATPLPVVSSAGRFALKRKRCSPDEEKSSKILRICCRMEDDEDLQSLAVFLDAVHFDTRHNG